MKKTCKKIITWILTFALLMSNMCVGVFAAGAGLGWTIDKTTVAAGGNDVVKITITNDVPTSVALLKFYIYCDTDVFEISEEVYDDEDEHVSGGVLLKGRYSSQGSAATGTIAGGITTGSYDGLPGKDGYSILWSHGEGKELNAKTVMEVYLSVKSGAINGDYEIALDCTEAKNSSEVETGIDFSGIQTITVTGGIDASDYKPAITTNPVGASYAYSPDEFEVAALTVAAETNVTEGVTLSYQWYKENGAADVAVGTNSASYVPELPAVGSSQDYYCVVTATSAIGSFTATSTAATITYTKANQSGFAISSQNFVKFGETLELTTTGGNGEGAVSFDVTNGAGIFGGEATLEGNVLTPVDLGYVTVTATKAADSNYNEATATQNVTVTFGDLVVYENAPVEYDVSVYTSKTPVGITIPTVQTKAGADATPSWSASDKVTVDTENKTMTATDSAVVGDEFNVVLTYSAANYNWKKITYHVTVMDRVATDIEVTTQPTNKNYVHGDALDTTGMVVKVTYDDGTVEENSSNYTIEYPTGTSLRKGDTEVTLKSGEETVEVTGLTVGTKALTISGVDATDRTYDGTTAVALTGGTLNGVVAGDVVDFTLGSGTVADANAANDKAVVTAIALTGADAGNYTLTQPAVTVNIAKAPLTVTANAKAITYGEAPANDGVTYSGFVGGETEAVLTGTLAYDYNYTQYGNVGSYSITPKGYEAANYAITYAPGTLTVAQKEIGLEWSNITDRVYGDGKTVAATAAGTVNGDEITVTVSGGDQTNAGENYTATATALAGEKAGNYKLPAANTTTYSIGRATIAVPTAKSGLTYTGSTQTGVEPGTGYTLTGNTGVDADNYTATATPDSNHKWSDGTDAKDIPWTIAAKDVTETKNLTMNAVKEVGSFTDPTFGAVTGALAYTGTYTSHDAIVAQLATMNTGETLTVNYEYTANGNYTGKISGTITFTIVDVGFEGVAEAITVAQAPVYGMKWSDIVKIDATKLTAKVLDSVCQNAEYTLAYADTIPAVDGAAYTVYFSGTINDKVYENIPVVQNIPVTIAKKDVTITGVGAESKEYDGNAYATVTGTPVVSGALEGDEVSVSLGAIPGDFADKNVGTGKTVTFSGFALTGAAAPNYNLTAQPAPVTANITAKALTITGVSATDRTYDGTKTVALTGGALDGVIGSDDVDFTLGSGTVADANAATGKAVVTAIALTGADAGNYALTQPAVTVDITKAPLTIDTVAVAEKEYDGTTAATVTGVTFNGLVSGETLTLGTDFTVVNAQFYQATPGDAIAVTYDVALANTVKASNYELSATRPAASGKITKATPEPIAPEELPAEEKNKIDSNLSLWDALQIIFSEIIELINHGELTVAVKDEDGTLMGQAEMESTTVQANKKYEWVVTPTAGNEDTIEETTGEITLYQYAPYVPVPAAVVAVEPAVNGTVALSTTYAPYGANVVISAVPNAGFRLSSLSAVDYYGNPVAITDMGNGQFTFVMPSTKVTVSAVFAPASFNYIFTDVAAGDWYFDSVYYAYENGLMNGMTPTTFGPGEKLTRGMLMTILARLDGVNTAGGATWYSVGMQWAVEKGISDGTMPEANITREQAAAMLYRFVGSPVQYDNYLGSYPDSAKVSAWATDAMSWAVSVGLIGGDDAGRLNPTGTASRAEIATMLMRFVENVVK